MVAGTMDYGRAYAEVRGRAIDLVATASDEQLDAPAPATPGWRVRDLLAHLAGVTTDILTGNVNGVGTDSWTAAQVDARRGRPVESLISEWEANGPSIDPMIPEFGPVAGQLVADATTHEHDIRGALDVPGARESDAIEISFVWIGELIGELRDRAGAGAIRIETESGMQVFGTGEPAAHAATTRFDIIRAATGRRSIDQIEMWRWDGDPRVDLIVLPIFTPREKPLFE